MSLFKKAKTTDETTNIAETVETAVTTTEKTRTKKKKHKKSQVIPIWKISLLLFFLILSTIITALVFWALSSFKRVFMDEILWHLKTSLKGTNSDVIQSAALVGVGCALLILIPSLILLLKTRKKPKTGKIVYRTYQVVTSVILVTGLVAAYFGFHVKEMIRSHFMYSSFIEDEYVDPATVNITFPEKKRNLIFIYVESMEITFMDQENGGGFKENIIPELTALSKEYEDFSGESDIVNGGISLPFTEWTMGAVFGTTSGLPLKTPLGHNGMIAKKKFFPGVTTLGDILEAEGYKNVLMMGSDSEFGGCSLYYEQHGNFEIHDYPYAKKAGLIPDDYHEWWGFEDEKLFEFAKDELLTLSEGDQPFQLVIQTMDTHSEDGYKCHLCDDKFGKNKYANVINCSSRQIDSFVKWIQEQSFYENTTIIITGDHPTMDTDFCDNVPKGYKHKVFTCIINPAAEPEDKNSFRVYSTIDLFPTTIAAIGGSIEGERLGLGTNLFSSRETLLEQYGHKKLKNKINLGSKLMDRMFDGKYHTKEKKSKP